MTTQSALLSELEDSLAHGSAERRAKTLRRVTDLFVFGSEHFSEEHVAVFGTVFIRLIADIEQSARAALANRLAPVRNAPSAVMNNLAFDNEIEVAGPVLERSEAVDEGALVMTARTKSQQHLLAISRRRSIAEAVTDVLVARGSREVALSTVNNTGASFSDAGYALLVRRSEGDDELARSVGMRPEIPRQQFVRLLSKASRAVRLKLEAANIYHSREIQGIVADVANAIQAQAAASSRNYAAALERVASMRATGALDETALVSFVREGRFEETTAALASMCDLPIDAVERAMALERAEMVLLIAKAIGTSWPTVKEILLLKAGRKGLSEHALEHCLSGFMRLKRETAQLAIEFHRQRQTAEPSPPG